MSGPLGIALECLGATLAATPASSIAAFRGALGDILNLLARSSGRGQRADLRSLAVCLLATLDIGQAERNRLDGDVDRFLAEQENQRVRYDLDCEQAEIEAAARAQLGAAWRRDLSEAIR